MDVKTESKAALTEMSPALTGPNTHPYRIFRLPDFCHFKWQKHRKLQTRTVLFFFSCRILIRNFLPKMCQTTRKQWEARNCRKCQA